jgi:hypothetical protein
MKLGKPVAAWGIVAALGYVIGLLLFQSGVQGNDASSLLKASAGVFAAASFSLSLIFRAVDTPAPKDLDDRRQERWAQKFGYRWKLLWMRWFVLLGATFVSAISSMALDGKFSLVSEQTAFASGSAAVALGLLATIVSVIEIFRIREAIQKTAAALQENRKRQEVLNRLEGPNADSEKHVRA